MAPEHIRPVRHKTAIRRVSLSRPVRLALEEGVIRGGRTFFDYGCGRGDDLRLLREQGVVATGWDPVYQPEVPKSPADVVNLGFVLNVVEYPNEREVILLDAWKLARKALVVAVRTLVDKQNTSRLEPFGDGYLTPAGTFQRFYEHGELGRWLEDVLGCGAVAASHGIYFVFRDSEEASEFAARRFRRPAALPRVRKSDLAYTAHRALLDLLMKFYSDRGRLPNVEEDPTLCEELQTALGSVRRAWRIVLTVTGAERWGALEQERREDLLIYLALARIRGRPRFTHLPLATRLDIRAFWGSYSRACTEADTLLLHAGDRRRVSTAIDTTPVGKKTPNALYVHVSALQHLPPTLRVYEGAARTYLGIVPEANVIKLHRFKPQVSYLVYPGFDRKGHPLLAESLRVDLSGPWVRHTDYSTSDNPPVLHRKELLVSDDYPRRAKFLALTRAEERRGLLDEPQIIGTRKAWAALLVRQGLTVRGHRLSRR